MPQQLRLAVRGGAHLRLKKPFPAMVCPRVRAWWFLASSFAVRLGGGGRQLVLALSALRPPGTGLYFLFLWGSFRICVGTPGVSRGLSAMLRMCYVCNLCWLRRYAVILKKPCILPKIPIFSTAHVCVAHSQCRSLSMVA